MNEPRTDRALAHNAVLATLGSSGPLSRIDLSRELRISPATVTQVVRRLVDQGMVEELEHEASTGGRPAQRIGIVATAARAVGVKVAVDHLAVVESRLDGSIAHTETVSFDARGSDAPDRLAAHLTPLLDQPGAAPLLGVGLCVPGIVDTPHNGRVQSPILGWDGLELGRHLRHTFQVPVLVENDVKALAVTEQLFGRGRLHRDFLILTIGRGIGAAVISDGRVVRGAHGAAGEIGHLRVVGTDASCRCGRRGCLEAVIGESALLERAATAGLLSRRRHDMTRLHELARQQDPAARVLFADAGRLLARTVSGLIAGADPELIIVLGEGASGWSHWTDGFRDELSSTLPSPTAEVVVEVEDWDDTRWAQGAAALLLAIPFRATSSGSQTAPVLARLGTGIPA